MGFLISTSTRGSLPATFTKYRLAAARRLPADINRAADLLIGGWQTTGIATLPGGLPIRG